MSSMLNIGWFEDIHYHEPAILIWGEQEGLEFLSNKIREACLKNRTDVNLFELHAITFVNRARIRLEIGGEDFGMVSTKQRSGFDFHWRLSRTRALQFADLIEGVARSSKSCHNYLDTENEDSVVVIVSKDEYIDRFWDK